MQSDSTDFAADPTQEWQTDLSNRHETIIDDVNGLLDSLEAGGLFSPQAVIGPYGSGKTQFLYEVYRRAWERGIPAVYVDLRTLVSQYDQDADEHEKIVDWVKDKIVEETNRFIESGEANWTPHFRTSELEREFYEEHVKTSEIRQDRYVLLIDEVEQKYTELSDRTDDKNPIRDLLDEIQNVLQFWSFGLVSAYEVTGEADRRRFNEIRIPIMDVDATRDQLSRRNQPPELANGIWWLARGRPGWVSKHTEIVSKYTESLSSENGFDGSTFDKWLTDASRQEYYGAPAITTVWEEVRGENITDAKRTILFVEPAYENWVIDSKNVIAVSDAYEKILDFIRSQHSLSGTQLQIVESSLRNILTGLSPRECWQETDDTLTMYLPQNFLSQDDYVDEFLSLVSDFVMSFEKRGEDRQEVAQILSELNRNQFATKWGDLLDPIQRGSDVGVDPWTIKPAVVREAYPPLALRPEVLTEKSTPEIDKQLTEPVQFKPKVSILDAEIRTFLCPNEDTFNAAFDRINDQVDVTTTNIVITPDRGPDQNWETPPFADSLEAYDLLTISQLGGPRVWNLIIQLTEYKEKHDYDGVLSPDLINEEIIPHEEKEERSNTIDALFSEFNRMATDVVRAAKQSYQSSYRLPDSDRPLWAEEELSDVRPFYGRTGSTTTKKEGMAYALVLSERTLDHGVEYTEFIGSVKQAYNDEYIDAEGLEFGYIYLLRQLFDGKNDKLPSDATDTRDKYVNPDGNLKRPVLNLQRALMYLSEKHDQPPTELYEYLEKDKDLSNIRVLNIKHGEERAKSLLLGLMTKSVSQELLEKIIDSLEETEKELQLLVDDSDQIISHIDYLNRQLKPPSAVEIDQVLSINPDPLTDYQENAEQTLSGFRKIADKIREINDFAAIGPLLIDIAQAYESVLRERIKNVDETVNDRKLVRNIKDVRGEFRDLHRWINSTPTLDNIETDRDHLADSVESYGAAIFDYTKQLGGRNQLSPSESQKFEDLEKRTNTNLTQLSDLNELVNRIEEEFQEAEKMKQASLEELYEVSNRQPRMSETNE